METSFTKEIKPETNKVIETMKELSRKEEEAFAAFLDGFRFAKQIERTHF